MRAVEAQLTGAVADLGATVARIGLACDFRPRTALYLAGDVLDAAGLGEEGRQRRVIGLHAFRNALIPVVTTIGLQVGTLMAGAILTETIFSWPGIGKWMIDAIGKRDYVVVQSGLLIIALIVMAVNLIVDVLYAVINPRIRVQ